MLRKSVPVLWAATPCWLQGWGDASRSGWGDDSSSSSSGGWGKSSGGSLGGWGSSKPAGGGGGWGSSKPAGGGSSGGWGAAKSESSGGGWGSSKSSGGDGGGWGGAKSGGGDGGWGAPKESSGGSGGWGSGDSGWGGAPTGAARGRGGRGGGGGRGRGGFSRGGDEGGNVWGGSSNTVDAEKWGTAPPSFNPPVRRVDPLTLTAVEVLIDGIKKLVGQRVQISGLSDETTWHTLKDHLRQVGEVGFCKVFSGGRAVVEFVTPEEAARAITELQGSELEGATMFLREDREDTVLINTRRKIRDARDAQLRARKAEEEAKHRAQALAEGDVATPVPSQQSSAP